MGLVFIPQILERRIAMRVLYKRTIEPIPPDFVMDEVYNDILTNWRPNYNLFSVSQIADRNNKKRSHVQKHVRHLVKLGLAERHGRSSSTG